MPRSILLIPIFAVILAAAIVSLISIAYRAPTTKTVDQPIAFTHIPHVREAQLDCTFCHRNVTKGASAGIPAVEQCMACHTVAGLGNPEVEKLRAAWLNQEPINWVRVHRLPDHTHFVHEAHIRAGFTCAECHGDVGSMAQVRQVRSLTMGDCVDCHRQKNASTDCTICHN